MSFDDPKPIEAKNPHALWSRSGGTQQSSSVQRNNPCAISAGESVGEQQTSVFNRETLSANRNGGGGGGVQESGSWNTVSLSCLFSDEQQQGEKMCEAF